MKCPNCDKTYEYQAWLDRHMRTHENGHVVVPRTQWKKAAENRDDLLTLVQFLFPKGISTKDKTELANVLGWIEATGNLLEKR